MTLNIVEDYTETPGGRYISEGEFSGEDFRERVLIPKYLTCLALKEKLIINFDGGYGYPPGFLEESFGGMIRKGFAASEVLSVIYFISEEEPEIIDTVISYIQDEDIRSNNKKDIKTFMTI